MHKKQISSHPSVPLEDQDAVYVQYFLLFYYILFLMAILKHPLANWISFPNIAKNSCCGKALITCQRKENISIPSPANWINCLFFPRRWNNPIIPLYYPFEKFPREGGGCHYPNISLDQIYLFLKSTNQQHWHLSSQTLFVTVRHMSQAISSKC